MQIIASHGCNIMTTLTSAMWISGRMRQKLNSTVSVFQKKGTDTKWPESVMSKLCSMHVIIKNFAGLAGEMAQWFRALAVLP